MLVVKFFAPTDFNKFDAFNTFYIGTNCLVELLDSLNYLRKMNGL